MIRLCNFILCFLFINFIKAYNKTCRLEDALIINDLPGGITREVVGFLMEGEIIDRFIGCLDGNNKYADNQVRFWFYNRENPDVPLSLNDEHSTIQLDLEKPTKIIMHGWLGNSQDCRIMELKDAYLKNYDYNIISVEWTKYAVGLYSTSFCYLPKVADTIANYLCSLADYSNGTLDLVHVVGHSMGGQLAGLVGQSVQTKCQNKLGRITALDPAGPLFTFISKERRLDPSDAAFVDVIHTNQFFLGYYGDCGSVDFYPNCGTFQPGCADAFANIFRYFNSFEDIIKLPLNDIVCNHFRAFDYMIESVSSPDRFVGVNCNPFIPFVCDFFAETSDIRIMGEHTPHDNTYRRYCVTTNSQSPFAQGK